MAQAHPHNVTQLLSAASAGDARAADQLLPLLYQELRRLAEARIAQTPPGNTLQATALVHEAYLRLVGSGDPGWKGRNHFFGAAAQAMRDVLVEQARRKGSLKRGGDRRRLHEDPDHFNIAAPADDVLAVHEALQRLEQQDVRCAEIVALRYFAGLTESEVSKVLCVSERTVRRDWRYARSWLQRELEQHGE